MGRILAIDYGAKRIGLAVTDPLQMIANPLDTISTDEILDYLKKYVNQEEVDIIVVGMPTHRDGSDTHVTSEVRRFMQILTKEFPAISLRQEDERFTSKLAQNAMVMGGMKKKQRQKKGNVDRISAVIILQSFLERKSFGF